ncbi:MAG TPA: carboxypeptidase-like regulatory domain-containing protein [Verrucomicrobiae bacterium]|nr:carboxypeptidase-like regulatory domain-containing protein [Verrucomicrobiae bacterium]
MLRSHFRYSRVFWAAFGLLAALSYGFAQESRGSILGKVTDPQNAIVPNANVVVTDIATGVSHRTVTNSTGYYEVSFLDPGPYRVEAEATGFKKTSRGPITLDVGDHLSVDLQLQIGQATESVQVTADAPLLDTASAAQGHVLNSRDMAQLPIGTMNPFLMQAMAAGAIFSGSMAPDNNRAMDNAASANYDSGGLGNGTNEFLLDGNPITGTNGGRAGFVPNQDAVDEMRIETSPYDASMGHSIGDFIMVTTKTGTNTLHGSGFWQFQQIRWNATPHYTRLAYQSGLANGTVAPGTPEQASGRLSQPGFSLGGPVYIPKLFNGKNKLFFFVNYSHITSIAPPNSTPIYSVPTAAERNGDFSALLVGTANPTQYIVYDPRSASLVGGQVTRTPFPNNTLPASIMTNPITKFYSQLYPLPNNPAGLLQPDGTNNFYDGGQPDNDYFPDFTTRIDYNIDAKQRLNGKYYFDGRTSDQYDWAHSTPLAGVESNGLYRPARGASIDYTRTLRATSVLDVILSVSQYSEGDKKPIDFKYNAQAVGLPSYIDQKAGAADSLPWINIAGVANAASTSFIGEPGLNQRGTTGQFTVKLVTVHGNHTFKYGWEERRYHYAYVNPLGNVTGYYTFSNTYDMQAQNTPSNQTTTTGLGWASFLMGMPTAMSLDTNSVPYDSTDYHAGFFQDDFRVTSRLRIGFGLRFEREGGTTERFNQGLAGMYDFSYVPPYASAVQAQYASLLSSPPASVSASTVQMLQQGMPASQFVLSGGVSYLGQKWSNLTSGTTRFLPNASVVYQINPKTVFRAGTAWYSDTFNSFGATSTRPLLNGYNQSTSTTITTDHGLTFCCGVGAAANIGGVNPLMNPFPVLASGSRFVLPVGNALGSGILDGQGFTYYPRDYTPAWEQKASAGIERQIYGNHMIDVSFNFGYASVPFTQTQSPLPAQYWNFFDTRSSTVDTLMQTNVPNPFLAALPSIQTSNPTLYNYLSTIGIFTTSTLQVQQLLRAHPNAGFGLSEYDALRGKVIDDEIHLQYTKRMSHGFQETVLYSYMWGRQQWLPNQFNTTPSWQLNPNIRPNRLVWNSVWELPFGKGRQWLTNGPLQHIVGGWELAWTYTYQTGPLISWGNNYYYGSIDQIVNALNHDQVHSQNINLWYSNSAVWQGSTAPPSGFVGFEGRSSAQPNTYQARVFPQYINSLRADGIRDWDVRVARSFRLYERMNLMLALDMFNMTNHTQFTAPNTTVTSSSFGVLSGQSNWPRILQFNVRVQF